MLQFLVPLLTGLFGGGAAAAVPAATATGGIGSLLPTLLPQAAAGAIMANLQGGDPLQGAAMGGLQGLLGSMTNIQPVSNMMPATSAGQPVYYGPNPGLAFGGGKDVPPNPYAFAVPPRPTPPVRYGSDPGLAFGGGKDVPPNPRAFVAPPPRPTPPVRYGPDPRLSFGGGRDVPPPRDPRTEPMSGPLAREMTPEPPPTPDRTTPIETHPARMGILNLTDPRNMLLASLILPSLFGEGGGARRPRPQPIEGAYVPRTFAELGPGHGDWVNPVTGVRYRQASDDPDWNRGQSSRRN
jgi:hypothetical protein